MIIGWLDQIYPNTELTMLRFYDLYTDKRWFREEIPTRKCFINEKIKIAIMMGNINTTI